VEEDGAPGKTPALRLGVLWSQFPCVAHRTEFAPLWRRQSERFADKTCIYSIGPMHSFMRESNLDVCLWFIMRYGMDFISRTKSL